MLLSISFNNTIFQVSAQNLSIKPIAYWNFDNISNGTVPDESGNNLTGRLVNAFEVSGITGKAVYFSGKNSYMIVNDSNMLHMAGISISIWFRPTPYNRLARLIGKGTNYTETFGIYINQINNDQYYIYYEHNGFFGSFGYFRLNDIWNQIVYEYSPENESIFFNGEILSFESTGSGVSLQNNTDPLILGTQLNPDGNRYPYNGSIDEVQIYNQLLLQTDVNKLYSNIHPNQTIPIFPIVPSSTTVSSKTKTTIEQSQPTYSSTRSFLPTVKENKIIKQLISLITYISIMMISAIAVVITYSYINYKKNNKDKSSERTFKKYAIKSVQQIRPNKQTKKLSNETLDLLEEIINENK